MIHSKGREFDLKTREQMLELTEICLKKGNVEDAKLFGAESARLKKRIEMYDYRYEDMLYAKADALDKKFAEVYARPAV